MNNPLTSHFFLSRREWLLRSSVAAGVVALSSSNALAASDESIGRTAETIHQEVVFNAAPRRVYDALTDARQFQKVELLSAAMKSLDVSSHPAVISREPGGAFSLFGNYIVGRQIELVANERIVQAWRVASRAVRRNSVSITSASRTAKANTSLRAGMRTIGNRCRNS